LNALIGLEYLERQIENFAEIRRQIYEALDQVIRASSAVECLNSMLRPYISVKKHLSQGFLALIARELAASLLDILMIKIQTAR
jgi:hypothetical protein